MREQKQKEIQSIRPRIISLNLSDSDARRITEKAACAGLTVAELLQSFIGDLTDGTYSNGSDEREYAQRWYSRCGYNSWGTEDTFLRFLINVGDVNEVIQLWEGLQDSKANLKDEIDVPGDKDQEFIQDLKDEINHYTELLHDVFYEYKHGGSTGESLETEMEKVLQWYRDMKAFAEGQGQCGED